MKTISKVIALLAFALLSGMAQAATYYDSSDNCQAAWRAGKAAGYQPTAKHKDFGDERVAGFEKRALEGDACVYLGAQPGKRWVFLKQGTLVYTKGAVVKFLAECQNDIYELVYLKKDEPKIAAPVTGCGDDCNKVVVQTITHVVKEVKVCEDSSGKRFAPQGDVCNFAPTQANVGTKIETKIEGGCPGTCVPTQAPAGQKKAEIGCQGTGCVPHEETKVTRKEPRTDGRCMIQTNMGYRFELRAHKPSGRLMVGLVNPQTEMMIEGTRPLITPEMAAHNSQGYDCDGMQAQVYAKWEAIRASFGLPSACSLAGPAPQAPQGGQPNTSGVSGYTTPLT